MVIYPFSVSSVCTTDLAFINKKHNLYKFVENKWVLDCCKPYQWNRISIEESIQSIDVFRDQTHWSYKENCWEVMTDVAIRIQFSSHKLLIVLQDLPDESLDVYVDYQEKEEILISSSWSKQHWGMKCENADFLSRKTIFWNEYCMVFLRSYMISIMYELMSKTQTQHRDLFKNICK